MFHHAYRTSSLLRLIIITSLCLWGCGNSSGEPTLTANNGLSLEGRFDLAVRTRFQREDLPALAAGLWQPGRRPHLVLLGQADESQGRSISSQDHFRIGSVTKSFTVTVLLQLAQEGKLSLDDPIGNFVPQIQNSHATLKQCANMTSGIFNYTENQDFTLDFIQNLEKPRTEQELILAANAKSPYFPPGQDWHYSNTNTVALGLAIEQVTGNNLATEIQNRILTPLSMTQTSYPQTVAMPVPFAVGYGLLGDDELDLTATHPSASAGSGAMVSTLNDLRIWGQALGSGSLISPENQLKQLELVSTDSCPECPEYDGYGLGIGTLDGWRGHTGDYIGYQALVMYHPETQAVVVILVNIKNFSKTDHVPTDIFREFSRP